MQQNGRHVRRVLIDVTDIHVGLKREEQLLKYVWATVLFAIRRGDFMRFRPFKGIMQTPWLWGKNCGDVKRPHFFFFFLFFLPPPNVSR